MITKIISWTGTIASIIGAFLVSSKIFLLGYCFFTVGSLLWLIIAIKNRDFPLGILNLTFFIANCIGLHNFMI